MKYFLLSLVLISQIQVEALEVYGLRCNYRDRPMGIDDPHPIFTFKMRSSEGDMYLEKIEFQLSRDATFQQVDWKQTTHGDHSVIRYSGPELLPDTRYYYRIKVESQSGIASQPAISYFKTGIRSDFGTAQWLTSPEWHDAEEAAYFRFSFEVEDGLDEASLYIVSGGPHEYHINGDRSFDQYLNPVFVNYSKVIPYNSYDVRDHLNPGQNTMGLVLGNGWYNFPKKTSWGFNNASWRGRPKLKFLLVLKYKNGDKTYLHSDQSAVKFGQGLLKYNSIYTGELVEYDSTLTDWSTVDFNDQLWHEPGLTSQQTPVISQNLPPIVLSDSIQPTD